MLKSALKKKRKPDANHSTANGRRVTFCETVKVFTTEALSESLLGYSGQIPDLDLDDLSEDWDPFANKCLILSWQEDGAGDDDDSFEDGQSEKPEDFLVHKVFYDPVDLKETDSSNEHDGSASNAEQEPDFLASDCDSQAFVVHQVNRAGDDHTESDSSSDSDQSEKVEDETTNHKTMDVNDNVCKLSVENIEQHNKILETETLVTVDVPELDAVVAKGNSAPTGKDVVIGLSPPLKELSIERFIRPSSDKWFWNLDISPLNSVQESDSESNLSSEDTMIMMTSEECEKNEKRIQESFKKFESIKKSKGESHSSETPVDDTGVGQPFASASSSSSSTISTAVSINAEDSKREPTVQEISEELSTIDILDSDYQDAMSQSFPDGTGLDLVNDLPNVCKDANSNDVNKQNANHCHRDSVISLDSALSVIEIPPDVREWKIELGRRYSESAVSSDAEDLTGRGSISTLAHLPASVGSFNGIEADLPGDLCNATTKEDAVGSSNKPDELELFVDQCTERVERLRKRYSLSEKPLWSPPRRSFRPRYGSTTGIIQQMHEDSHHNHSTAHPNSHYSWPTYTSLDCEVTIPRFGAANCSNSLPPNFPSSMSCDSSSSSRSSSNCSDTGDGESYRKSFTFGPRVAEQQHLNIPEANRSLITHHSVPNPPPEIPTSFLFTFQERGVPEGASPPRLSSESLYDSEVIQPDSIVYYSMKV